MQTVSHTQQMQIFQLKMATFLNINRVEATDRMDKL